MRQKLVSLGVISGHDAAFGIGSADMTQPHRKIAHSAISVRGGKRHSPCDRFPDRRHPPLPYLQVASRSNIKVRYVDMSGSSGPANLSAVITDNTRLVMIESPTNPMQRIINMTEICRVAHSRNALVEVDSTMMTPCLQKPLSLGADLVVHSATKFISGHADVMAGVVVAKTQELSEQVRWLSDRWYDALS